MRAVVTPPSDCLYRGMRTAASSRLRREALEDLLAALRARPDDKPRLDDEEVRKHVWHAIADAPDRFDRRIAARLAADLSAPDADLRDAAVRAVDALPAAARGELLAGLADSGDRPLRYVACAPRLSRWLARHVRRSDEASSRRRRG